MAQAKADYVVVLDHKTLLEPTRLEKQVEFLERHRAIDVVTGHMKIFFKETSE